MTLRELLLDKKIVVCCGSGGVGKTTTAAALAVAAAVEGRKVIVLTIDPARRLANAMGLSELGNEARRVPADKLAEAGVEPAGELWAMMLDTKRTFDELVEKYAPSDEIAGRILDNLLYQNISNTLAGSHEYMAMEKLHELYLEDEYDLIILDTPPTRHALDFLDAPKRMTDFLDGSVLQWFVKPYFGVAGMGLRVMQRGTQTVLKSLERITGMTVLKAVSDFFQAFEGMYEGFKERAAAVYRILRGKHTTFLLVTSPEDLTLEESIFFHGKLRQYKMPFGGFVVNKVHPDFLAKRGMKTAYRRWREEERGGALAAGLGASSEEAEAFRGLMGTLQDTFENFQALAASDAHSVTRLEELAGTRAFVLPIPYFREDIYDIRGLALMNAHLLGGKHAKLVEA